MLTDMKNMVEDAAASNRAVAAFNVFGYEDAAAVVQAAEKRNAPVILAANAVAITHMPLHCLGALLCAVAERASVPVCVHLDHGRDEETIREAIACGFTSVMYDGSQLPLEKNIEMTKRMVAIVRENGVSIEAEIGSVGYNDPTMNLKHELSDPGQVKTFVEETEVDAVAVSVGTVHRMEQQSAAIRFDLLEQIESAVRTPLVIHGSSGVPDDQLRRLVAHRVGKINIGTALRMAFGKTLREEIERHPHEYDRIRLFQKPMAAVEAEAARKLSLLGFVE